MQKAIRSLISLALCLAALLCCALSAAAVMPRYWPIGDADRDYELTIMDATRIQRLLAGFGRMDELDKTLCDADDSGAVTILDATVLQRYLAQLPCNYRYRELTDYYVVDTSFHSTAEIYAPGGDSGREIAYVGVPVTYIAQLKWGNPPQRFRFSVNGETLWESEANGDRKCAVTHTFMQEGVYEVQMDAPCRYGVSKSFRRFVEVRSLPADGSPVVMGAAYYDMTWMSSGNDELTVTAAGGTGPYEYNYTLYYAASPDAFPAEVKPDPEASPAEQPSAAASFSTGYIPQDTVNPPQLLKRPSGSADDLYIRITVRDAKGMESEPVTVVCYQYEICL